MKGVQWMVMVGVVALAGCGKSTTPPQETKPAETKAPETKPPETKPPETKAPEADAETKAPEPDAAAPEGCVLRDVFQPLTRISPDHAALSGDSLTLCGQTDDPAGWCFSVDFASGKIEGAKQADDDLVHVPNYAGGIDDPLRQLDGKHVLQLCKDAATGCKDVYVGDATAAKMSDDGKRIIATTLDDHERRLRVFDGPEWKEIANYLLEKDADLPDCSFGVPAGDLMIVSTGPCPAGVKRTAYIANATTNEKVADVAGAADFDLRFNGYVHVKDTTWAFREGSGKAIVLQDIATGKVLATADLSAAGPPGKGATWLFASADPARLVAVENRPQNGAVYLIDPSNGALTKSIVPAACP